MTTPPKLLHLCAAYSKSKLYSLFFTELAKRGFDQTVFVPTRTAAEVGKNIPTGTSPFIVIQKHILKPLMKIRYFYKLKVIKNTLLKSLNIKDIDLIHAHFLFSDGGVAYHCHQLFKIPYIVSVRNTDIHMFFKYAVHLRRFGLRILENATYICLLSPSYKEKLFHYIPEAYHAQLSPKIKVIPNGIDSYWLEHRTAPKRFAKGQTIRLLYCGEFSKNKNIQGCLHAIQRLEAQGYKIQMTLVGNYGHYVSEIKAMVSKLQSPATIIDRVHSPKDLQDLYQNSDIFMMPSFKETFGLVYIEALSQGLPIIYSKGQGVDGYFESDKPVGLAVNPRSVIDISEAIIKISEQYQHYTQFSHHYLDQFDWTTVSQDISSLYLNTAASS